MTHKIRKTIEKKKRTWAKWKETRKQKDKEDYKEIEKRTKRLIRNSKNRVEKRVAKESKENPKLLYSYINSGKNMRSKIGPLKDENEELVTDPKKQAEKMNKFFASVFTRSKKKPPEKQKLKNIKELHNIKITEDKVKEKIDELKEYSAPGPDSFPPKLIKEIKK